MVLQIPHNADMDILEQGVRAYNKARLNVAAKAIQPKPKGVQVVVWVGLILFAVFRIGVF